MIRRAIPTSGVTRGRLFFERAAGSVQFHLPAINLLRASPLISPHRAPVRSCKPQNVCGVAREGAGIEPCPERLDLLHGQDAIARRAGIVSLQSAVGSLSTMSCDKAHRNIAPTVCRRFSASRSMPCSATASSNSRMSRRRISSAYRYRIGASARAQAAFDFLCCPQAASNPAPHVEFYQLFDGEPRSRGNAALLFLGDQIAARPRRAGQLVGTLTCLFEAHIGRRARAKPAAPSLSHEFDRPNPTS